MRRRALFAWGCGPLILLATHTDGGAARHHQLAAPDEDALLPDAFFEAPAYSIAPSGPPAPRPLFMAGKVPPQATEQTPQRALVARGNAESQTEPDTRGFPKRGDTDPVPSTVARKRDPVDVADLPGGAGDVGSNQDDMNRLFDELLGPTSGYNADLRPLPDCSVYDCTHKIKITMGLKFEKLLSIDEVQNTMTMLLVLGLAWPDHRLAYNSSTYFPFKWDSQEDFVAVNPDAIWKPNIELTNSAKPIEPLFSPRAFLYDEEKRQSEGYNVRMRTPIKATVKCDLLLKDFPFDTQTCDMVWRPWSSNHKWVAFKLFPGMIDLANASSKRLSSENEEFSVSSIETHDGLELGALTGLGDSKAKFPEIIYQITLQRGAHFYVFSIILPILMTLLLSVGAFFIDPGYGERLGYSITLFLTVMAVAFFTTEMLPRSGGGDTWLERFQAVCYAATVLPIFVSLFCELLRRHLSAIHRRKVLSETGAPASEELDTAWVTNVVDGFIRGPYAIFVATVFFDVAYRVHQAGGDSQMSVRILGGVLTFVVLALIAVGLWDMASRLSELLEWRTFKTKAATSEPPELAPTRASN